MLHVLCLNRKVQDLKGAAELALFGCVTVAVCWCLALTGEDLGTTIPRLQAPESPFPKVTDTCQACKNCACSSLTGWLGG